ncbi:MAG: GNAT family N-acetyltransferase [Bacteroidota bacterium]
MLGLHAYETDGHIDLLFTSPKHSRKGIASALYQHVESILANNGVRFIQKRVWLPFPSLSEKVST